MAFAQKIRRNIGESGLKKRLRTVHRNKHACNISEAHTAGILFDATDPSGFEPVKSFASRLADQGIQVQIIGYVHDKKVPDAYLLRRSMHFFSKNELNWVFRPVSSFIEEFTEYPFDILFNLDLKNHYPLRYLTTLSRAGFKTGLHRDDNEFLDFMINLQPNPNLENLIFQLQNYLGELKTQPPAQVVL